jgi:hypothetical protein
MSEKAYAAYIVPLPDKLPDYPPGFVPAPGHDLPGGPPGQTKPGSPESPGSISNPIVIPGDPQHPIADPPGSTPGFQPNEVRPTIWDL